MALIIETGTGVAGANSYQSAAGAGSYHAVRGTIEEWASLDEAGGVDGFLIDATRMVEKTYSWLADILTTTQGLGLPREDIELDDGRVLDGAAQVAIAADAVSFLALRLWQDRAPAGGKVKRSETLPDYSVAYDTERDVEYPEIDRILAPIIEAGSLADRGFSSGKLVRWS